MAHPAGWALARQAGSSAGRRSQPGQPPSGCRFRTRWKAEDLCKEQEPELIERETSAQPGRCHFAEERYVVHAREGAETIIVDKDPDDTGSDIDIKTRPATEDQRVNT